MHKPDWLSYFLEKSQEPGFDFSSIRKEMEQNGVSEAEIKTVVRQVDDAIISRAVKSNQSFFYTPPLLSGSSNPRAGTGWIIFGAVSMAIGLYVTVSSYFTAIDGGSFMIAYGPILFGLTSFFYGLSRRKQETSKGRFRRRWQKDDTQLQQ